MRKATSSITLSFVIGLTLLLAGVAGDGAASASSEALVIFACPAGTAAITGLTFSVNGHPVTTSGLVIQGVASGDTVTASFTVAPGCTDVPLSFSAYNAVANVASAANVGLQTLNSNAAAVFAAGPHTLTITVPSCFFQVDLYRGPLVTQWTGANLVSFFSGTTADTFNSPSAMRQMLGNATGGTTACSTPSGIAGTVPPVAGSATTAPTAVAGLQTAPRTAGTPAAAVPAASVPAAASVAAPAAAQSAEAAPATEIAGLPSTSTSSNSDLAGALGLALIVLGGLQLRRSIGRLS